MTEELFDLEADVIVVGSGAAGFAAALTAAHNGADVIMLERAESPGGTTIMSGGTAWIPNNSLMRAHGIEDPRDDCLRFLARVSFPQYYDPAHPTLGLPVDRYELLATFYDRGSEAVDFLLSIGATEVGFDGETPDYHAHMADDRAPYGRRLPQPSGSTGMIARFDATREELGARLLLGHRVHAVLRNDLGEVCGAEVHVGHRAILVQARRAMVFASGGYLQNAELVRNFLPGRVFGGCAALTNTGDFLRIGQQLGAQLGNMGRAWWTQILVERVLRAPGSQGMSVASGDSMIQVNRHGRRVVNEKAPYNERAQVHFHWSPTGREYPNLLLFQIWDEACAQVEDLGRRIPIPPAGTTDPCVVTGADLEELAQRLDERLASLVAHTGGVRLAPGFLGELRSTMARFDGFARAGVDADFHRGESPIEVKWNGAGRPGSANPTMAPFGGGPYHCVILGAGAFDTNGGPRIDTQARVLDVTGSPIPGLYGAGNCIASVAGQSYWGPGGTIGPALTFGYLAGLHASAEPVKKGL